MCAGRCVDTDERRRQLRHACGTSCPGGQHLHRGRVHADLRDGLGVV
jgi:hypothetical protein